MSEINNDLFNKQVYIVTGEGYARAAAEHGMNVVIAELNAESGQVMHP